MHKTQTPLNKASGLNTLAKKSSIKPTQNYQSSSQPTNTTNFSLDRTIAKFIRLSGTMFQPKHYSNDPLKKLIEIIKPAGKP